VLSVLVEEEQPSVADDGWDIGGVAVADVDACGSLWGGGIEIMSGW
jgi:hypothetical protein